MHASSYENMQKCYARYIEGSAIEQQDVVRLLDVGGSDVNGSYRDIFCHPRFKYTASDIDATSNAQLVFQDSYRFPLDDQSMDIVISGQMLEHCEFFWLTFAEMMRVVRPGGYVFLIAPSSGPEHRYPVDCYRFYPDAYRALARYANCALIDLWQDPRGPWKDLVGVFQRHGAPPFAEPLPEKIVTAPEDILPGTEGEEKVQGQLDYLCVLRDLQEALRPQSYLEIGIRHGRSLALATGPAVGVDPQPALTVELPETTRIFAQTSDAFFDEAATTAIQAPIDFAFIDGLHLFEAALRDFMHVEQYAAPGVLVAVDDILPNHPIQAKRDRESRVWTGDVWKLVPVLRKYRPDLTLVTLDTTPSGCLLIGGLDPANRVLWDFYNPIVREALSWGGPPDEILSRQETTSPIGSPYVHFIEALVAGQDRPGALRDLSVAGRPGSSE
ncbi:methyltransferase domain-containing protein [Sphingobium sufflavum]|uniref:class I SAM-dependent methyltransferase n=1 Tax=Sphingobium sufflavum TaxID=1129547 RepID=UPI001F1F7964|nr:class I SAM-dependent methyltransferase [Sphingobium sufflavum]MCE7798385.1 methyltransferase domain-containing protein [Sphingobium sufflavum]